VLEKGEGHLIPENDPNIVTDATDAVVTAVRTSLQLSPCSMVFVDVATAFCLARGQLGRQQTSPDQA
jgi:hypothetical protein